MKTYAFPTGFVWGAASSAFQIEGTTPGDGRGRSIWDDMCDEPGRIADGSNGLVACRHTELWPQDVDLLHQLGAKAYRFSLAWPRILPDGRGRINEKGFDFYEKLIDGLLAKGITPWVTLYHWDLPSALEKEGGWRSRDTALAFADYAEVCARRLSDRVKHWITHNEPWCVAVLGHRTGEHAPGMRDPKACVRASHHVLLSHGLAMPRLRQWTTPGSQLGITLNLNPAYPANPTRASDVEETRIFDGDFNRWYLDPIFRGSYPNDMLEHYAKEGSFKDDGELIQKGDLDIIRAPIDFLGVNFYSRAVLGDRGPQEELAKKDPDRYTDMGWEIYPQGISDLMLRLNREYPAAAYYITENGASYDDHVKPNGEIHDPMRERYYVRHLEHIARLCQQGVPMKGYFAWSIMDNFEWAHGYRRRFGITYVDYGTQKRTPKTSFKRLAEVMKSNQLTVD